MIQTTRLAAALAFAAGLTGAGLALAQTQTESPAQPAASAPSAPPPGQTTPSLVQPETPIFKPWDPSQPSYSANPPPGDSGVYLPAVILGYGKSVAGCVVIGCADGPQAGGAAGSSPSGSSPPSGSSSAAAPEPPPGNPGPIDRR